MVYGLPTALAMLTAGWAVRKRTARRRPRRRSRGLVFDTLEPRRVLDGGPLITEFMADNESTRADQDGDFSDWIEIHNPTDQSIDLDGWYLTDSATDLNQWRVPAVSLGAGEYRMVFASKKDRVDPAAELHTNFRLSSSGDSVALVMPDGNTVAHAYWDYPPQLDDVSYGLNAHRTTAALVDGESPLSYLLPTGGTLGTSWTQTGFDDSAWTDQTAYPGSHTFVSQDVPQAISSSNSSQVISTLNVTGLAGTITDVNIRLDISHSHAADLDVDLIGPGGTRVKLFHDVGGTGSNFSDTTLDDEAATSIAIGVAPFTGSFQPEGSLASLIGQAPNGTWVLDVTDRTDVDGGALNGWSIELMTSHSGTTVPTTTGIGYEDSSVDEVNFAHLIDTAIASGTTSLYTRFDFDLPDPSPLWSLTLRIRYDDGFAAYLNGTKVADDNAPASPQWDSTAAADRPDDDAIEFEEFDLTPYLGLLQSGDNLLAIQGLNVSSASPDFLLEMELIAGTADIDQTTRLFMVEPTPGGVNSVSGPAISFVTENPPQPSADDDLVIQAWAAPNANGLQAVDLHFRIDYGAEQSLPMSDDGLGVDAVAGDGIFAAAIDSGLYGPGDMVRWYVTATDMAGNGSRAPVFADQTTKNQDPEYYGTVVADPAINTELPVFQWFTENAAAAHTRPGTRGAVFYQGRFYDNIFVRQRGGYTNAAVSQKFDFNKGDGLWVNDQLGRVSELNMNGRGSDASYLRQPAAFTAHTEAGGPASASFYTYMTVNGSFDRVGILIEQVDQDLLDRHGYDANGDLYKFVQRSNLLPSFSDTATGVEKKTGDRTDFTTMNQLIAGLAQVSLDDRQAYIRDYLDIPQILNYMAVRAVQQQADDVRKNFYMYQDALGDQLWRILPWDLDWTFEIVGGHDRQDPHRTEHPFWGVQAFPTADGANQWNVMYEVLFETVDIQRMFLRRVRTLMDEFYGGPPGSAGTTWFADYAEALFPTIDPHLDGSATNGKNGLLNSIENRRSDLYDTLTVSIPGYSVVIPGEQPGTSAVEFGQIDHNPASGNQDEEFVVIHNPNGHAVDVSDWTIDGGITHTFQSGTVIGAGDDLYLTFSMAAFRGRATAPTGGQGLFVQAWTDGHLSSFGETLTIRRPDGSIADQFSFGGDPSPAQLHLRITEVNYNPADADPAGGELNVDNEQFEFIELINTSATDPLDLTGVHFSDGVQFDFSGSLVTSLAPGERVLVVKNHAAFESRYGTGLNVAGQYGPLESLSNNGEQLKLEDATSSTVAQFTYGDSGSWPGRADGRSASLDVLDSAGDHNDSANWRSSVEYGGSPGRSGIEPLVDVVVNEVLSHTDVPFVDAIELHNTTAAPIDIGGWYLSDSWGSAANPENGNYKKFHIPAGTTIAAGEYLVFDESDFNGSGGVDPNDFGLSGAHGDDVWLVQADGAGKLIRFADHVEFGAAINGESFGRWPDGSGGLYPMISTTFGTANSGPRVGPLIVSEIMYHPSPPTPDDLAVEPNLTEDDLEFVEIYNPTSAPIDLTNWRIRGGIDYDFAPGTMLLEGRAMVILSFDPGATDELGQPINQDRANAFRRHYLLHPAISLIGGYTGRLDDGGERVELQRPDMPPQEEPEFVPRLLEDEVLYDDTEPWPVLPDGAGQSLTRFSPAEWGHAADSWTGADPTPGAHFLIENLLTVESLTPTASGFEIQFSRAFHAGELNLYDVQAGTLGPADVTLVGDAAGPVTGSLVVRPDSISFVATGGPLPADTYSVTLRSAVDGFKDLSGRPLDGNGDDTTGDDFVSGFIAMPEPIVIGLPDFARGPGQSVDVPATQADLPLFFTDVRTGGSGIEAINVTVTYDSSRLTVTGATLGPDAPAGAVLIADWDTPGRVVLAFTSPDTPLPIGDDSIQLVRLTADVPAAADYGGASTLTLVDVSVLDHTDTPVTATTDQAVHVAAYFGDATGNGEYSGLDAQRVARLGVGLDGGFAAYPTTDPVIIADVTGNGALSGLDAQRIASRAAGLVTLEIPTIPQPQRLDSTELRSRSRQTSDDVVGPSDAVPHSVEVGAPSLPPTAGGFRLSASQSAVHPIASIAPIGIRPGASNATAEKLRNLVTHLREPDAIARPGLHGGPRIARSDGPGAWGRENHLDAAPPFAKFNPRTIDAVFAIFG